MVKDCGVFNIRDSSEVAVPNLGDSAKSPSTGVGLGEMVRHVPRRH